MKKSLSVSLSLLFGLASVAMAAPFTNGDFELPGGPTVFLGNPDSTVTGWVHSGAGQDLYTANLAFGINAFSGTHYITFGGSGTTGGSMSQTFDTLIGTTYNVNYFLTTQQFGGGTPPLQETIVRAFDGLTQLNQVTNDFQPPDGTWIGGATLTFVATNTSTTLVFLDNSNGPAAGGVNWGLDAVTVNGVAGGAVPEPATFVLTGLGILGLGLVRRVTIRP
jgi:hypothetical protein